MKRVPLAKFTALGKLCFGFVLTLAGLLQIPDVKNAVIPMAANHPHVSTIIAALAVLGALMANPQVQTLLGTQEMSKETIEHPDGTVIQTETAKTTTISKP